MITLRATGVGDGSWLKKKNIYIYIYIYIDSNKKREEKQRWNGISCHVNSWVSCSVLRDNWSFDSLMKKAITTE